MTDSDLDLWLPPPRRPRPGGGEVHVWRAELDQAEAQVDAFFATLAPDERQRAGAFHFPVHRRRFVVARGVLRDILGRYLGLEPRRLRFSYTSFGKPSLVVGPGQEGADLRFNVSHAHGLALCAVTCGREIGVDVEYVREDFDTLGIAESYFSPGEFATLRALPPGAQRRAFFDCWTRKEAYIKALGEGLSHPLDQFDVSLAPGEPAALLRVAVNSREAAHWKLRELSPGADYVGAVAAEGQDWRLDCWQWAARSQA
jgi:4'-phosphopantetheinyl transferase